MPRGPADDLLTAYAANARVTVFVLENLHPAVWRAKRQDASEKTIAALAAHIHNCGLRYLERTHPLGQVPAELNRHRVTQAQAIKALTEKRRAVLQIVGGALESSRRIVGFGGGPARYLLYYMIHDAHHRGQIVQQARRLGHPLARDAMIGMWQWPVRGRE